MISSPISHARESQPRALSILFVFICILTFWLKGICSAAKLPATQVPYIINSKRYYPIPNAHGYREKGIASWYGSDFHGRRTSNGEIYDMYGMTAAHKTLPMDTILMVRNLHNKKKVVVRVNDRGPFIRGRIIDLSFTAAKKLGVVDNGTAKVEIVALAKGSVKKQGTPPVLIYDDLGAGEFYVQIGAFKQKINAIRLQKRFTGAGHTTVIQKYFGPDSTLFRVQVYAGKNIKNAERAEQALLEHGYVGCFIIAR